MERFVAEGLTFEFPASVVSGAILGDPAPAAGSAIVVDLQFASGGDGSIEVRTVRDRTGELVESLSTEDRTAIEAHAAGRLAELGEPVPFVNGDGARLRSGNTSYSYVGLTTDGVHLVRVIGDDLFGDGDVSRALDAVASSMFVDQAAPALAADGCRPDVTVLSEVVVDTPVEPSAAVMATWQAQNTGDCAWTMDDAWVFTGGDPVTIIDVSSPAGVGVDETVTVELELMAPAEPGSYSAQWQLLPAGRFEVIGPPVPVAFEVRRE